MASKSPHFHLTQINVNLRITEELFANSRNTKRYQKESLDSKYGVQTLFVSINRVAIRDSGSS